ncbi:aromatic compound dioxygenase [Setomelanomma holmii]|uniref:Aromatic compound dioxygenase n=1 Tax=Setomelanomma holmii TaxID=210430 RepID=A0A9P4H8M4_9PLEO|nr:aromatic compound dioxygenase [Setomelanomma holmii]
MVNFACIFSGAIAATSLISSVAAHPGETHDHAKIKREIDVRTLRASAAKRSLGACENSFKHRSLMERSMNRRAAALNKLRQKRGISVSSTNTLRDSKKYRRDLAELQEFETIDHNMTGIDNYTPNTLASDIFVANTSCILAPEVTDGPYYVTGELIRQKVKEDQVGIDLYLEVQYVDVTTCDPVTGLYIDIWNCNATGVYSGVESGQGGLNSTFLRGVQESDEDGVVAFETIFPGHYEGRAVHTHLLTKTNVTVRSNGTTGSDGAVTHIGQLFWPEDLISAVEATEPYASNTVAYTSNDEDMWSIVQADAEYDPFPQFVYLGEDITDGLMAWIQIGINATADYTDGDYYNVAATYQAGGGVANADSGFTGGAGGNGTMNGTMPSGAAPSGATPSESTSA